MSPEPLIAPSLRTCAAQTPALKESLSRSRLELDVSVQCCCQRHQPSTNAKEVWHDCTDGEDVQAGDQPAKRAQKVALTHLDEEEDEEG